MTTNLICKLLSHRFSAWEYVSEGSCKQIRTCKRDGFQEVRIHHDDWQKERTEERFEPVHPQVRKFEDIILLTDDEYHGGRNVKVIVLRCTRCGAEDEHSR